MPNPHGGRFSIDLHFESIEDFASFVSLVRGIDDQSVQHLATVLNASTQKLAEAEQASQPQKTGD